MIFYRSYIILCLGEIQCCGVYHRMIPFRWFAPSFSAYLHAHLLPRLQHLFRRKDTQVDANDHEHALKKKAKLVGWSSFLKDLFLSGFLFPRNFVVENWTVANPDFFLCILASSLDRISCHTYLLASVDRLLFIAHSLHCFFFFCPQVCPWLR